MRRAWNVLLSARAWCVVAALLVLAWAMAHGLGWRDDTRIISGTGVPSGGAVLRGVAYAVSYFAAVVVAPILVIAAGLRAAGGRVARGWGETGRVGRV